MKKLLFLLIAMCSANNLISQDLRDIIITEYGDSIRCKISAVKSKTIYFLCKSDSELKTLSFPLERVKAYRYYFYKPQQQNPGIVENADQSTEERRILFSAGGGYGYRIARLYEGIPQNYIDYCQKLRSGFVLHANVSYLVDEQLGLGLKVHHFSTSNELASAKLKDEIGITFFGPSLSWIEVRNGTNLYTNSYIGYIKYSDNATNINPYEISGGTFGFGTDFGLDIELAYNFFLNLQLSLSGGVLKKFDVNTGTSIQQVSLLKDRYENLYRIDLTAGIKFK